MTHEWAVIKAAEQNTLLGIPMELYHLTGCGSCRRAVLIGKKEIEAAPDFRVICTLCFALAEITALQLSKSHIEIEGENEEDGKPKSDGWPYG